MFEMRDGCTADTSCNTGHFYGQNTFYGKENTSSGGVLGYMVLFTDCYRQRLLQARLSESVGGGTHGLSTGNGPQIILNSDKHFKVFTQCGITLMCNPVKHTRNIS